MDTNSRWSPAAQLNRMLGLVLPLPARRVHATFAYLGLQWPGFRMAPQTPPDHLETTPPPLLRGRMVAEHDGAGAVQPGEDAHHALPLPGRSDPDSVAGHGMRSPHDP